uniref:Putative conserved secreted protein n=1 Tax=Anopheles darlingi TaxID=43151 RepID=A0A2M4CJE5_ANODA
MMHLSGMRLLLTVLVSLVAVQNAAAFTEALDDIWSLLFDSSSSESDSMEMINLHTKNATIKVDCAVPCTLNVVCNNCNTMTSNMNPSDASTSTTVANGGGGTVPTSASVTTSAPSATTTTVPSSSTVDSSSSTTTDASP